MREQATSHVGTLIPLDVRRGGPSVHQILAVGLGNPLSCPIQLSPQWHENFHWILVAFSYIVIDCGPQIDSSVCAAAVACSGNLLSLG